MIMSKGVENSENKIVEDGDTPMNVIQPRVLVEEAKEILGDNPLGLKERLVEEGILSPDHPTDQNGLPSISFEGSERDYSYIYYLPDEKQGVLLAELTPLERAECELASALEVFSDTANNFDPFMQSVARSSPGFFEAGIRAMASEMYVIFHLEAKLREMKAAQSQDLAQGPASV
jgi:hypothetical protein